MTQTRWRYFGPAEFALFNIVCLGGMVGVVVTADEPLVQIIIAGLLVAGVWFFALRWARAVRRVRGDAATR